MIVTCKTCNKEFDKTLGQINKSKNHFCSRSCAAKTNNKTNPKRKPQGKCFTCQEPCNSGYTYCKKHRKPRNEPYLDWSKITYKEMQGTGTNKNNAVRQQARRVAKAKECQVCGYNKHIEIAHIKSISSFPDETIISIINSPTNIIALCPNCHWEFDHGMLQLKS